MPDNAAPPPSPENPAAQAADASATHEGRSRPGRRRRQILVSLIGACLLCWGLASACAVRYTHVTRLSGEPQAFAQLSEAAEFARAVDVSTLEKDVRYLASEELDGRLRGTEGNAKARAHLIERLERAGLTPLFDGSFEQPTFDGDQPHGTNVGAQYRSDDENAGWVVLLAHFDHLGNGHLGADDNASSAALLLAIGDALGRARPKLPRHVALVFPDAEEPPDVRTDRMGSSWFWSHTPYPLETLHLALVLDLMGGTATETAREAGLGSALFVLGAEASDGLARLARGVDPEPGMELLPASVATIEAMPFAPWKRYSRSDYHGLRELGQRPFLFLTTGRTPHYHTDGDTADTLDYGRMAHNARYLARLLYHGATLDGSLAWEDHQVDPSADVHVLLRLHEGIRPADHPALLRRALASDREALEGFQHRIEAGEALDAGDYRDLQLYALRLQAAVWHPGGWWFSAF